MEHAERVSPVFLQARILFPLRIFTGYSERVDMAFQLKKFSDTDTKFLVSCKGYQMLTGTILDSTHDYGLTVFFRLLI